MLYVEIPQEIRVASQLMLDECTITLKHYHEVLLSSNIQIDKIFIFESFLAAGLASEFGLAVNCATFQVKDALYIMRLADLHSMGHKHEVDGAQALDLDCVDAVNPG